MKEEEGRSLPRRSIDGWETRSTRLDVVEPRALGLELGLDLSGGPESGLSRQVGVQDLVPEPGCTER